MGIRHWLQVLGIVMMAEATVGWWFLRHSPRYHFHPVVFLAGALLFFLGLIIRRGDGNGPGRGAGV